MPSRMAAPSSGSPKVLNVAVRMTSAARGTPATPLLVSIRVSIMVTCCQTDSSTPASCATNRLAADRYSVLPSRFMLYPVGSTKPTMRFGTPKRSITSSDLGSAASLLAVVNAIRNGSRMVRRNVRNGTRIRSAAPPTTSSTKMVSDAYITSTSFPSVTRIASPRPPTVAAMAAITPTGANRMT